MSKIPPFHIMAKPASGICNLDCAYCYYTMKPKELYPEITSNADFRMTDEVLESYTRQYMECNPQRVEFGWQGGEPMLMGLDFYKRAVELQEQYKKPGQIVTNGFQTNATLMDDEWCEFLAENKMLVGISLDGPAQWHDFFRRDHDNNPTFHKAWAGLELAKKHGVEFNVLVTLNSMNAPHAGDIYRYFVNRGIQYVQFIPILERLPDGTPTPFSCSPEHFSKFMLEIFELWVQRDVGRVSERLIDSVLHTLIYGKASTCCYAERCANAHVLEFNGDLYVCDHFVYPEWKIGNIMETPLEQLVQDPLLAKFANLKTELPEKCTQCEFLQFCRGGCPKHHMPIGTDADRVNYYCEGLKEFFRTALPVLAEMAEYFKRGQQPPQVRQAPRPSPGQPPQMPANVKRNDPCPCGSGRKYKQCCGKR